MKASPDVVREAARWTALLDADDVPQQQRADCEAWCAQDPLHRQVFERMRAFGQRIETMSDSERRVLTRLDRDRQRRRARQRNTVLSVATLTAAGWWASQSFSVRQFWPDYQAGPAERRTLTLDDGSSMVLDAGSAVSIDLGADARRVALFRGRLFTTVARDPQRPLVVATPDGTAIALGTAFAVTRGEAGTEVEVTESRVRACPARRGECLELEAGERALINDRGVERLPSSRQDLGWTTGWLEADDRPLVEVLDQLNRYARRPTRFDAHVLAGLRVTGSYPLDDAERALAAIAAHLELEIETLPDGALWLKPRRP